MSAGLGVCWLPPRRRAARPSSVRAVAKEGEAAIGGTVAAPPRRCQPRGRSLLVASAADDCSPPSGGLYSDQLHRHTGAGIPAERVAVPRHRPLNLTWVMPAEGARKRSPEATQGGFFAARRSLPGRERRVDAIAERSSELGIQPVPLGRRALGFFDSFVLWADLGILFLVPGLGLGQALLATLIGAVIGNLLLALGALIGADVGVPTMVLLRPVLGIRGSYLPTVLNVVQLIGWATFEVIVMAQATDLLTQRLFGLSAYPLWVLGYAVLTTLFAVWGPVRLVKQFLERYIVWLVLATTVWITVALFTSYNIGELLARPGTGDLTFLAAVDLVVALPISWFPLVADYSRLSTSKSAAFWGTGLGYFIPQVWFYALGALLVLGPGVSADPNAPVAPLLAAIAGLTNGWIALLILLIDETDEGFANVYSTAVSIQNLAPWLSQRNLSIAIGGLVLILAEALPLTQYESFLLLIGSVFVPLFGVLAADYFVVRRGRYVARELFERPGAYWYLGGVQWGALVCWLVGAAVYLAIGGIAPLGIDGLAPWLGATLPSLAVSFLLYLVAAQVGLVGGAKASAREG